MQSQVFSNMQLVCFSHLPWNFVYQRPQHLLSRYTKLYNVYYVEEHEWSSEQDGYFIQHTNDNVVVVKPHLLKDDDANLNERLFKILQNLFNEQSIHNYIFWYYTPMALPFTNLFAPVITVYDCMDELSAFKFAPPELVQFENELFAKADVVFTGGNNLYQVKKNKHSNIHCFASSIDKVHFAIARLGDASPTDQVNIPYPRLGFYGVIDERFDINLIRDVAEAKPEWQIILVGPIVKIDAATLPDNENIHYLGAKTYEQLPAYLSGWDIALIPFAINESTKYISPTKTPEYLAAGKPVISTAITDVVHPYQHLGLVHVIDNAASFIQKAIEEFSAANKTNWLKNVDAYLANLSWDNTWEATNKLLEIELNKKKNLLTNKIKEYVRLFNSGRRFGRGSTSRATSI